MKTLPGGLLVTFDGIDGVGKTTQIELAKVQLIDEGWQVIVTRNLGGTPIGEALREAIKQPIPRPAMTDLYVSVAIQEALAELVDQERHKGSIILVDRSPLSLAAYQIYGSGADPSIGWDFVDKGIRKLKPDLNIIYDMAVDQALERAHQRQAKSDYYESQSLDYFKKVKLGYEAACQRYPAQIIKAEPSIDEVHSKTMTLIKQVIDEKASV